MSSGEAHEPSGHPAYDDTSALVLEGNPANAASDSLAVFELCLQCLMKVKEWSMTGKRMMRYVRIRNLRLSSGEIAPTCLVIHGKG
jgi:hypothetical protein